MRIIPYLYQWLLGIWLGGLLCFAAVLAPVIFGMLGPSAQAVAVVLRISSIVDCISLFLGAALLSLSFIHGRPLDRRGFVRIGLIGAVTLFAGISVSTITPGLNEAHERAGGSAVALPRAHPIHQEFDRFHRASASLM